MADGTTNESFTAALRGFPQVLDAVHVTGSYDYLLHAVVADPAALDLFVRRLKREAGAGQTFTRLALCARQKGPPAHPPELTCPCCLPALGEFSEMTPHEGSGKILTQVGHPSVT